MTGNQGSKGSMSDTAQQMRSGNPQERSEAASEMGQKGGQSRSSQGTTRNQ